MKHPYSGLPDHQFWKKEPGIEDARLLDPVISAPFVVSRGDRLVTAGSCFAQHVARFMAEAGFNHHITERAHPIIPEDMAKRHNYQMFAARYGNIYTARQLLQTLQRAYGDFTPKATAWEGAAGCGVVDPFRPQIQPGGFVDGAEFARDRQAHFAAIRTAVEEMDIFVFTLGLTEAWVDPRDGAVFPLAPGVAGGRYDPAEVAFKNFDVNEVTADLTAALSFIRQKRPGVKIILTVSPVPLNATYEPRHVLVSTAWSKAVLRIAAENCVTAFEDCAYFPSFEIITSPHARGRYFDVDCREVTSDGVEHVMGLFLQHFTDQGEGPAPDARKAAAAQAQRHMKEMEDAADILCDEAAINNDP